MRDSDGGGWSATTHFDQFSHAQLIDMVNGSAPASVSSIANTLNSASTQIESMADDLNTHITRLQWHGAAGDSFRGWARQVVQAMDDLAIFHNNAGLAMQTAGDTLSNVKTAMPPVPTADVATVDAFVKQSSTTLSPGPMVMNGRVLPPQPWALPVGPGQISWPNAYAAQGRVDAAHQEAIAQMEKLGGAYNGATQTMDVNQEPKFPPAPNGLMPPRGSGREGLSNVGGPGGGGSSTSSTGGGSSRHGGTVHDVGNGGGGGAGSVHRTPGAPGGPGGVATLQGAHPPVAGVPVHQPGGSGSAGGGGGHGSGGGVVLPPGAGAGALPPGERPPDGRGGGGPRGGGGGTKEPGGFGEGGGEAGIHGGGIGGRGAPGARSGGVLGAGRGGRLGGGLGGALRGSAAAEGHSGVVGEANQSSTAHSGQSVDSAAGRDGITGAGAGESAAGPMAGGGMGGMGGAAGRGRSRSGRAAYLSEDQETWTSGSSANPAVIE